MFDHRLRPIVDLCFDVFNLRTKLAIRPQLISAINDAVMVTLPAITPAPSHESLTISRVCLPGRGKLMGGSSEKV